MTRLIDADAIEYTHITATRTFEDGHKWYELCATYDEIADMPTVDLRKVTQDYASNTTIDAVPHWIPCSERLPEDDRSKVVTLANGITEAGYYSNGDWWCIGDTVTLENPTVIAWMPLPKPYEVEHDEIH